MQVAYSFRQESNAGACQQHLSLVGGQLACSHSMDVLCTCNQHLFLRRDTMPVQCFSSNMLFMGKF